MQLRQHEMLQKAIRVPRCQIVNFKNASDNQIEEEEEESPKAEEEGSPKVEEEKESPKAEEKAEEEIKEDSTSDIAEMAGEDSDKVEASVAEKPTVEDESKKDEARSVKQDTKSAAELAYEWDDDGIEDEKPSPAKTPKKKSESKPKESPVADVTPGRKSSRTPKPTQRKLESESQKNLKETEEEEEDGDEEEEDEESVDAIAKELEKSDSSPGSGGKKLPAKKGKKPVSEEKSKEEWVNLIFGENGEKVTEKGVKGGKTGDAKETKAEGEGEEGPDAEEFLPEDTPKAKKGGRPKKKGLDETLDGVAKKKVARSARNSANLAQSTLQEDLMKLISPDFEQESGNKHETAAVQSVQSVQHDSPLSKLPKKTLSELSLMKSRSRENIARLEDRSEVSAEVSFHMARPATVISNNSGTASPNTSNLSASSQPRHSGPGSQHTANIEVKQSPTPGHTPPETGNVMNMEWTSLVDTATKAISEVPEEAPAETEAEAEPPVVVGSEKASQQAGQPVQALLDRLAALESQLTEERQEKSELESEIVHLKEENVRLKEESQTAAQQLRRFTEWFFQTIDKS